MPLFPAIIDLATLDGTNGFRLDGIDNYDYSGRSLSSAGDVNGDGFDDIIISAPYGDIGGNLDTGEVYLVFGKATGFGSSFALNSLDGNDGFRLDGVNAGDKIGSSVSAAGDVNGDGIGDIIIGAPFADESYVVFGKATDFAASFDLSTLDGSNGFRLTGIAVDDYTGRSVSSAGDVNGDGFDDIIIGADYADPGGDIDAGQSYVVFGKASGFAASFNLSILDGTNGFRLDGIDADDRSGKSVSSAGDINGDGFADIIVGANRSDPGGNILAGESYVVFGKASGFAANFDLNNLDGTNGFRLDGIDADDRSGYSVDSAGDVNGDGYDDIIIAAFQGDPGGNVQAGESYVVFGKASGFAAGFDLTTLNGLNGFRLDGIVAGDRTGFSVSSAGDVNGDGFDDIIIGAITANPGGATFAGESYVVFGRASFFNAAINLSTLFGDNGFQLEGIDSGDRAGWAVSSAGDINGDGFSEILIGANFGDPGGNSSAGESYVVYGVAPTGDVVRNGTVAGQTLAGGSGDDIIDGKGGNDELFGNDGDDVIRGGSGDDTIDGGNGFDQIIAGSGDDTIIGSFGFDDINGGSGTDTLDYSNLALLSGIAVNMFKGTVTLPDTSVDTIKFIDGIVATNFADILQGDLFGQELVGRGGDDTIRGSGGNDILDGGAGADFLNGGNGDDFLFGGDGNDINLNGGNDDDNVSGGAGNDKLFGAAGDDTLDGGDNDDSLKGNSGADLLDGGNGIDDLRGGTGNDTLDGGDGADFLFGEDGNDILDGGAGDDADAMTGGAGADIFVYSNAGNGGGGFDRIKDFQNGTDFVDLTTFGFTNFNLHITPLSSQVGSGVRVDFGSGDVLFIENMLLADWDAGDVLI